MEFAKSQNALIASHERRFTNGYSLSPVSLLNIPAQTKIVLPSPNGSTLSLSTGKRPTICGCLRNAAAVAEYAMGIRKNIAVIPAGEKWEDGSLRVAFEDLLGAGALISHLKGSLSPESNIAGGLFENVKNQILDEVKKCGSGKELIARGFQSDVEIACELNVSDCVPMLNENFYEKVHI
jgi:2-phosphosulfolactate phosphatase